MTNLSQDTTSLGVITLPTAGHIKATDRKKKVYGFEIPTPSRTYYLAAETEAEKTAWLEALNAKKDELTAKNKGGKVCAILLVVCRDVRTECGCRRRKLVWWILSC